MKWPADRANDGCSTELQKADNSPMGWRLADAALVPTRPCGAWLWFSRPDLAPDSSRPPTGLRKQRVPRQGRGGIPSRAKKGNDTRMKVGRRREREKEGLGRNAWMLLNSGDRSGCCVSIGMMPLCLPSCNGEVCSWEMGCAGETSSLRPTRLEPRGGQEPSTLLLRAM